MNYETKAGIFQMLSHPVRLQILDELRRREACVCHLQTVTGRPQAYISQQLRTLREADLVRDEKDGQNVYYHLRDEGVRELLNDALGTAGEPVRLANCSCPFCSGS
jgi:DNA-binding transcriptional ArsR family regulator